MLNKFMFTLDIPNQHPSHQIDNLLRNQLPHKQIDSS